MDYSKKKLYIFKKTKKKRMDDIYFPFIKVLKHNTDNVGGITPQEWCKEILVEHELLSSELAHYCIYKTTFSINSSFRTLSFIYWTEQPNKNIWNK